MDSFHEFKILDSALILRKCIRATNNFSFSDFYLDNIDFIST